MVAAMQHMQMPQGATVQEVHACKITSCSSPLIKSNQIKSNFLGEIKYAHSFHTMQLQRFIACGSLIIRFTMTCRH